MESTKQARLLELFFRGLRGEELSVAAIAGECGVSSKSVSRDNNDLKAFFANHRELVGNTELVYSYQSRTYRLVFIEFLSIAEVFALVEVFLGAKAFSKMESLNLVEKLERLTTPINRRKTDGIIQKELYLNECNGMKSEGYPRGSGVHGLTNTCLYVVRKRLDANNCRKSSQFAPRWDSICS